MKLTEKRELLAELEVLDANAVDLYERHGEDEGVKRVLERVQILMLRVRDALPEGGEEGPREAVVAFARAMEAKLVKNSHKRGWSDSSLGWLAAKAVEEASEVLLAIEAGDPEATMGDSADLGNYAMMIWDRTRRSDG
jgi:phosphoribosyl-ATP pyrophosphohydrolase